MGLPGPTAEGPAGEHARGTTWATVALRLPEPVADKLVASRTWQPGPLPVIFGSRGGVETRADRDARGTYYPSELMPILYGTDTPGSWSQRRHLVLQQPSEDHEEVSLLLVAVEQQSVAFEGLRSDVLVLHVAVVPTSPDGVASDRDRDLACLAPVLLPVRHRGDPPPAYLRTALGLDATELEEVLSHPDTWFSVLRTARDQTNVFPLLRGAATGSAPSDVNVDEDRLQKLQAGRVFEPSRNWVCEVGTRGLGFVRRLDRRDEAPEFFDVAGPAYVRSIYFDVVHLVGLQNELLGDLRGRMVATDLPSVGGSPEQYTSFLALQRAAASYRIRLWWSSIGRGSWQEEAFRLLQSDWNLRERLGDLEAEASNIADLAETVAEQEAQLQRQWSRRASTTFSVLLGGVAALAVPQTLLAALALGVDLNGLPLLGWLPDKDTTAGMSVAGALVIFLGLVLGGCYAVYTGARARRSPVRQADVRHLR